MIRSMVGTLLEMQSESLVGIIFDVLSALSEADFKPAHPTKHVTTALRVNVSTTSTFKLSESC